MAVLWWGEVWYWDLFTIIIEYHQGIGWRTHRTARAGTVGHGKNMGTRKDGVEKCETVSGTASGGTSGLSFTKALFPFTSDYLYRLPRGPRDVLLNHTTFVSFGRDIGIVSGRCERRLVIIDQIQQRDLPILRSPRAT